MKLPGIVMNEIIDAVATMLEKIVNSCAIFLSSMVINNTHAITQPVLTVYAIRIRITESVLARYQSIRSYSEAGRTYLVYPVLDWYKSHDRITVTLRSLPEDTQNWR